MGSGGGRAGGIRLDRSLTLLRRQHRSVGGRTRHIGDAPGASQSGGSVWCNAGLLGGQEPRDGRRAHARRSDRLRTGLWAEARASIQLRLIAGEFAPAISWNGVAQCVGGDCVRRSSSQHGRMGCKVSRFAARVLGLDDPRSWPSCLSIQQDWHTHRLINVGFD